MVSRPLPLRLGRIICMWPVIQCAQCGGAIVAPEWSEHRSERCVRNVWSCEACGYRFEHTVYFAAPKIQPDLRVEENELAT